MYTKSYNKPGIRIKVPPVAFFWTFLSSFWRYLNISHFDSHPIQIYIWDVSGSLREISRLKFWEMSKCVICVYFFYKPVIKEISQNLHQVSSFLSKVSTGHLRPFMTKRSTHWLCGLIGTESSTIRRVPEMRKMIKMCVFTQKMYMCAQSVHTWVRAPLIKDFIKTRWGFLSNCYYLCQKWWKLVIFFTIRMCQNDNH